MYDIEMHQPSEEFTRCWDSAGRHLDTCARRLQVDSPQTFGWLKAELHPPFLEHLSFRLANQLFFVRIVDAEGKLTAPGNPRGAHVIAESCNGHACLLPMRKNGNEWVPDHGGWGLIDGRSRKPLDPYSLVTDELIEMTDWEIQYCAVQIVRDHIQSELGFSVMSWQDNPEVNPSIWFIGEGGPQWVTVRAARYPAKRAAMPENLVKIAEDCSRLSTIGHFASVALAHSPNDNFDFDDVEPALPLWRGQRWWAEFDGLDPLPFNSSP